MSENSIQPARLSYGPLTAIKVVHDIDEHSKHFIEDDQDKVIYALDELKQIVENLEMNYTRLQEYVTKVGLVSSNAV